MLKTLSQAEKPYSNWQSKSRTLTLTTQPDKSQQLWLPPRQPGLPQDSASTSLQANASSVPSASTRTTWWLRQFQWHTRCQWRQSLRLFSLPLNLSNLTSRIQDRSFTLLSKITPTLKSWLVTWSTHTCNSLWTTELQWLLVLFSVSAQLRTFAKFLWTTDISSYVLVKLSSITNNSAMRRLPRKLPRPPQRRLSKLKILTTISLSQLNAPWPLSLLRLLRLKRRKSLKMLKLARMSTRWLSKNGLRPWSRRSELAIPLFPEVAKAE